MYFLSKLLPALLMPLNLVIAGLFFICFKKRNYPLLFITIFLTFLSNGLVTELLNRLVEHPWKRLNLDEVTSADAIVVLSQRRHLPPGNSDIIEWWDDPDRFVSGLMLINSQKANKLIFTGGSSPFLPELPPEGDVYKNEAISFGVSSSKIFTTGIVRNTKEESIQVKQLLGKINNPKIILVTSAFHMNRSKKLFEKQEIDVVPYPVDFRSSKVFGFSKLLNPYMYIPNASSLSSNTRVLREILGRIIYKSF